MRQIGKFSVEDEPIGIGGMGKILRGHDSQGRTVAIKEIAPEFANDLQLRYYIEKEVKILWELDHPSIVNIYTSYFDNQTCNYYIVMEFVDGMNIEQYVKKNGPMSEDMAVKFMQEILNAMQHVHYHGIIHRDIKPSNIMIRESGDICLLDFGVAKDTKVGSKTQWGSIIGTDGYMSPEQADGLDIDSRADIYALGCVLFFMLTGHHAFNTFESEVLTRDAILNKEFPRLSKYRKGCSNIIQQIIDKATDRNMLHRYQTCAEFASALNGTGSTEPPEPPIKVTVGREKCDIIVNDITQKISRHHADIELRDFTGGRYYVFTDCSANGTLVNNKKIHRESVKFPYKGPSPEIYLAGMADGKLDWKKVTSMLKDRSHGVTDGSKGTNKTDETEIPVPNPTSSKKWLIFGFLGGLVLAFIIFLIAYFIHLYQGSL